MEVQDVDPATVDETLHQIEVGLENALEDPTPYSKFASDDEQLAHNTHYWWSKALPYHGLLVLSQVDAPILLLHSKDDLSIPYESAHDLQTHLRKQGQEVTFITYEGGHVPPPEALDQVINWLVARAR